MITTTVVLLPFRSQSAMREMLRLTTCSSPRKRTIRLVGCRPSVWLPRWVVGRALRVRVIPLTRRSSTPRFSLRLPGKVLV
jgi:hypothetical protein